MVGVRVVAVSCAEGVHAPVVAWASGSALPDGEFPPVSGDRGAIRVNLARSRSGRANQLLVGRGVLLDCSVCRPSAKHVGEPDECCCGYSCGRELTDKFPSTGGIIFHFRTGLSLVNLLFFREGLEQISDDFHSLVC